eukprot:jgi/Mesvir1/26100/Mv06819-RA.1
MVANLPETLNPAEGAGRKRAQRAKGQISRGSGKTYLARLTKILRRLGYEPDKDGARPVTALLDTKKVREAVDALSEPSERGGKKDRAITKKTNAKDLFSSINSIDNQMDAGKRIPQDVREAYVEDMATSQEGLEANAEFKGSERKKVSQYSPRGHGVGSEQIARSIEAMAKVSPGSRIINVEEHAGEDGRTYYMSRWTVDPVVPCIVCKKDRPHKSAGHGPRVCEYSDARVTYSCWKKGPKHAECIMDRFEYVSESVEFTQVYCEDKPEESTKAPKLKKREKETHDWYILSDEEYSQLSERKSDREVLSAKELKLIDIYELCHKAYKIPRHLIDEDLAYLLAEEENRDMYRAREQYSRVTELGWEAAVGDIEDRARESSDIFALTANKKLSSMDKLTIAKELLRGSGVMEFCLDGGSAPGMVLSRENVLEVVNRVDKDYIYKFGSRFRSVFDYRRRSKNKAGKLEFDQCVSVLENMLKVTLDVDVTCIEGKGKGKASGVMVSKARMLEFLNRYRPAWLGEQAEIAESARATREFYRGMDGYQFLTR